LYVPDQSSEEPSVTRADNRFSGQASGPVIQAGAIHGNVTVNAGEAQPEVPLLATPSCFATGNLLITLEDPATVSFGSAAVFSPELGVKVLVEALTAQAVVLRGMRVAVVSRTPPRPAFLFAAAAGILEQRGFRVDLDARQPRLEPTSATGPDFPFTVSSSDPELFAVFPRSTFEVHWRLELDWTSRGRSGTVVIDRDGQPFHFVPRPRR
jgi:hypothetical protein